MNRHRSAPADPRTPGPADGSPPHHGPDGRFRNPWPLDARVPVRRGGMLQWVWERLRNGRAPTPDPDDLPRATPAVATPRVAADDRGLAITWIGHASFLVQLPGVTVLTDPHFSRRASPVSWAGPARISSPGMTLEELPPVDAVVLSHDHYDHLDAPTVEALHDRYGDDLAWITPLRYAAWFERRGITNVRELDWWETDRVDGQAGSLRVRALPARHWTRRRLFDIRRRLWGSWALEAGGRRVYFAGDSGYGPGFSEIGDREAPFDVALIPIGAYAPRWFMRSSHVNPEEAAQAAVDVGGRVMVGMHWGTFRLSDEPPLEPPVRARRAWKDLGLPADDLYIPALGQTLRF